MGHPEGQEGLADAEEAFQSVIFNITDDDELLTFEERVTTNGNTAATAVVACFWAIGAAESALFAAQLVPVAAAAAALEAPGRLVEALKSGVLTLEGP